LNYRKATLYKETDATTAKTETIDIDILDIISRIQIQFHSTNDGHIPTAHHAAQISKVELVDGSDVLGSLSAKEIEALMFFNGKKTPYEREFRNGVENYLVLDLDFGRKLWDPLLAFDPKRYKNPQLKITHNKASGGSAPNAATLQVMADVFDEKVPTPMGYLMSKEFYSFTSAASAANEYVDLPNDHPIRRILLQTSKAGSWWENLLSEIELDEETGKRRPIELTTAGELVQLANTKYGPASELYVGTFPAVAQQTIFLMATDSAFVFPSPIGATDVYTDAESTGGQQTLTPEAVTVYRALCMGFVPHGVVPLDLGDLDDPTDWFDVTKKGKVRLRLKASGSVTFNVILEQLRKY
jgi:hypothetical protein